MPGKRAFEQRTAEIDAFRDAPEKERIAGLKKALANRSNFLVAKAANIVSELNLTCLTDDLLAAFDRFFEDAEKTDPQCWAKNAICKALAALEHQDPEVFLRGMRHIQMEPVWGGRSDTAGTLRATCALALVQCRRVPEPDLLAYLVDLFADKDKAVRAEVVRAIEQVGSSSASLLLRLRATLGNDEPEVLGACYAGILRIEGTTAIPWVGRFLMSGDDNAAEAALAIAGTHTMEGFKTLSGAFEKADDPWWRSILLSAIALTRQDAALEFLIDLVKSESLNAEAAIEAVMRSAPSDEITKKLEESVSGNPRLTRVLAERRRSR